MQRMMNACIMLMNQLFNPPANLGIHVMAMREALFFASSARIP
jgi:hypothetical protein